MIAYLQNYLQNKFALSRQGAKDLLAAIAMHTLLNLSFMLPVMLGFAFLDDYVRHWQTGAALQRSVGFYLLFALLAFVVMYLIATFSYNSTFCKIYQESATRRIQLAETLRQLPMAFFGKKDTADLSATIMEDATQIEQLFSHAVPQVFASLISIFIMSVLLFLYNWQMSLAMLWVVPAGFLMFAVARHKMGKSFQELYEQKRAISDNIQDGLDNVQEIKSYHQESQYLHKLNAELDAHEASLISGELLGGALLNVAHFTLKLGLPSVILFGAIGLADGSISIFTYLVFLIIVGRIYDPFIDTMNHLAVLLYLDVRIQRMREMDAMPRQTGATEFNPPHHDIEFKNVDFSYQQGVATLKNVSFTAKQGEITALIGPSGGGKSTTAKLAARFWDIDSGTITLGGEDIAGIDPETLLGHFSIVFQDVALFNASVMENIRLGRKGATDTEVIACAKQAQCDDFVSRLTDGYDTLIGENGEKLSGGERQRISIARALLKDAPVILLDEATASLDTENESKIQQAIKELIKDKTVLIIAHRMRTITAADKIIALKDGQIAEIGTPQQLQAQDGIFARRLRAQEG